MSVGNYPWYKNIIIMAFCKSIFILALISCVRGEEVLAKPCSKNDIKCLTDATANFLEKTSAGIPDYHVKPLDPLIIPSLDVVVSETMGLVFHFKNLNVTGLKNQKFSDFSVNTDLKNIVLKTKAENFNVVGDIVVELTKVGKSFSGVYRATTSAEGTTTYDYSFVTKNGKIYYEVGKEKNTCEIIGEPQVNLNDSFRKALAEDEDAKKLAPQYSANNGQLRKKALCAIVEAAYETLVHNIRACARVFPKEYFFTDI